MAKSTYISTNMSAQQMGFLQRLEEEEVLYFSLEDLQDRMSGLPDNLPELVENLNHKGFLCRIERGRYARQYFKYPYVLGTFLVPDGQVGYWSALHLHGLTERFPNKVFVKTTHRRRAGNVFGTPIQFVSVNPKKMLGHTQLGYGNATYAATDLEATLLDCFDQPRYAGDWPDLLRAFAQAPVQAHQLMEYAKRYGNLSAIKRMGYLAAVLQIHALSPFVEFAKEYVGKKHALLNPMGLPEGKYCSEWMLRLNMSEKEIINAVENPY